MRKNIDYIVIPELPQEEQEPFLKWVTGKTMPDIAEEGDNRYQCFFKRDYDRWLLIRSRHTKCLHMTIEALEAASDEEIEQLTGRPAAEVLPLLVEKKAAGEVYIPSAGCENFNPITGCPGHQ